MNETQITAPAPPRDRRVDVRRIDCDGDTHLIPTMPDDTKDHDDNVYCWCCPRIIFACGINNIRQWMHFRYVAPGAPVEPAATVLGGGG